MRKVSPIWYVRGEWSIRSRLEDLIGRVNRELVMLCYRTDILKELAEKIREISYKKTVICMVVDRGRELVNRLGNADLREPVETDDFIREVFHEKVFKDRIETNGVEYRVENLFIADGKESMLIYEANGERMALIIKLPIITSIQRAFLRRTMDYSRKIGWILFEDTNLQSSFSKLINAALYLGTSSLHRDMEPQQP